MTARFVSVVVVMLVLVSWMFYTSQNQWGLAKAGRKLDNRIMPFGYFDDEHSEVVVASNNG